MHRSFSLGMSMSRFANVSKLLNPSSSSSSSLWSSSVRTISTTVPTWGKMKIEKQIASRLLDTSRNVEKEDTKEINEVALSKDGRVIVCWHPETPFPYEFSKPLPMETIPTESTLKVQALLPVREVFRKKNRRMMVQELMRLTHTAKYPWLIHRRPRKERYGKLNPNNVERDREYL